MAHVFISYVRQNSETVEWLRRILTSHGVEVWLDRNEIAPGVRWKGAIRKAIEQGSFFIACFSKEYNERDGTYMNEELTLAVQELRKRARDRAWFIPVKLSECEIPDWDIGAGETFPDIQWVELYRNWDNGIRLLIATLGIYSSEALSITENRMPERIIDMLNSARDEIRMLCTISGGMFSTSSRKWIESVLERNVKIRILLFDNNVRDREARVKTLGYAWPIELEEYGTVGEHYTEILRGVYKRLPQERKRLLTVKTYGFFPMHMFCIIDDRHLILDNYCYGRIGDDSAHIYVQNANISTDTHILLKQYRDVFEFVWGDSEHTEEVIGKSSVGEGKPN